MRWVLAAALVAVASIAAASASEPLPVFATVADEPYVPIAVVCDGDTFLANAVFVDRDLRLFVTNAHVIRDSPTAVFLWLGARWVPARFGEFVDVENDLAVIQAESIPSEYRALALPLSRASVKSGDVLILVGAFLERRPAGYVRIARSWPSVVALPDAPTCVTIPSCSETLGAYVRAFLQMSMTDAERKQLGRDYTLVLDASRGRDRVLCQGLSGSPALDRDGSVAGILSAIVPGSDAVAFFAPGFVAAQLVDRARTALGTRR